MGQESERDIRVSLDVNPVAVIGVEDEKTAPGINCRRHQRRKVAIAAIAKKSIHAPGGNAVMNHQAQRKKQRNIHEQVEHIPRKKKSSLDIRPEGRAAEHIRVPQRKIAFAQTLKGKPPPGYELVEHISPVRQLAQHQNPPVKQADRSVKQPIGKPAWRDPLTGHR